MTPALLFALVDGILSWHLSKADRVASFDYFTPRRREFWAGVAEETRQELGWWRSLWPLGGGL